MYVDGLLLLSDSQALTATANSTNTIDLGSTTPKRQVGSGEPLAAVVAVEVAADFTTGDETYRFDLVQSASASLTTPTILGTQVYIASGAMISSLLTLGFLIVIPMNAGYPIQQYVGMVYTLGGTTPTITVTSFLTPLSMAMTKYVPYAKGYTIS